MIYNKIERLYKKLIAKIKIAFYFVGDSKNQLLIYSILLLIGVLSATIIKSSYGDFKLMVLGISLVGIIGDLLQRYTFTDKGLAYISTIFDKKMRKKYDS